MTLLQRIEDLCDSRGITIYKLEKDIHLSQNTIRKWDKAYPTSKGLTLVADYFDVSVDFLLGRSDDPFSHKTGLKTPYGQIFSVLQAHKITDQQANALAKALAELLIGFV